jgi:hypothetical protein
MSGTPMLVSIAMGILCSELCHPALRHRVLTFETDPQWVTFNESDTFSEKVRKLGSAPWGGSTNFYKALERIGQAVEEFGLAQDEIPKTLLVVSDMQFDEASACGYDETAAQNVKDYFAALGRRVHGAPLSPPTIVFWNVRATKVGFPAKADTPGVILMSGFSAALLKFIFSGEMEVNDVEVDEETGEVNIVKRQITPAEMLDRVLNDTGLDLVRARLDEILISSSVA